MITTLRLRKILRDLWLHRQQTLLVLLAIGSSVVGVSVLARTRAILVSSLDTAYLAAQPPQVEITTSEQFDDALVAQIRALPQVWAVEGMHKAWLRYHFGDELWRPISLIARADYTNQHLNQLWGVAGFWPPTTDQAIWLERSALEVTAAGVGDKVTIDTIELGQVPVQVTGLVYAPAALPSRLSATLLGYTTLATLQQLTGKTGYNKLYLKAAPEATEAAIAQMMTLVQHKLAAHGVTIAYSERIDPTQHPLTPIIRTTMLLLGVFGVLALLFSSLVVSNTLIGLLAQQTQQIGVMKALGLRHAPIVEMYLSQVALLGLAAYALATPIGIGVTIPLIQVVARQLNVDIISYQAPAHVYGLELVSGVLIPLLAGLAPVLRSTRVTVRAAIQSGPAVIEPFGLHWLDQWLKRLGGLPPHWLYIVRNLLRRKVRLTLTLFTLTLAGVIFMIVLSLRASLLASLAQAAAYWQQDILLELNLPLGQAVVKNELLSIPGVLAVEARLATDARRQQSDQRLAERQLSVVGLPPDSPFLQPTVLAGRWLRSDELNGLVVNVDLLQAEPDIQVGQTITLEIDGYTQPWQVVGLVTGQLLGEAGLMEPILYVNYHYWSERSGQGGLANQYLLAGERHDRQFQIQIAQALEEHLKQFKLSPERLEVTSELRDQAEQTFGVVVGLVQFAILLFAVVGGLGLMSIMSLSVLERTRELGIIRVVGGTRGRVAGLVLREGLLVSALSWSLALLLAWPLSRVLCAQVGLTFVHAPLIYRYPAGGPLLWLVITLVLSLLATYLPAREAARVNLREALTFE